MAFFNSSSPAYKTAASLNAAAYGPSTPSTGIASLFGSLLGGTSPAYKTLDAQAGQAPAAAASSSGLMRIFIGSSPSYKTAQPSMSSELVDDGGGDDADDASCLPPIDTVVVL